MIMIILDYKFYMIMILDGGGGVVVVVVVVVVGAGVTYRHGTPAA